MGREVEGEIYYETRLTAWLGQLFQDLGVPYRVDEVEPGRANVVAALESPGATRTVMLDAHQDTVPVEGMTIPPFEPVEKEGRLYGRGACDVKGGMAAMLSTFLRLLQERPENACNVLLSCTCDEEATLGGIQHLAEQWNTGAESPSDLLSAKPDLAIVAEPTELDVIVAHKGVIRWKVITRGRACHSSAPEEGENAIYRMGQVLQLIQEYATDLSQNGWLVVTGDGACWQFNVTGVMSHNSGCSAEHSMELPSLLGLATAIFSDLRDSKWIDKYTDYLVLDLSLYYPAQKLFSSLRLTVKQEDVGHLSTSASFATHRLFQYENDSDMVTLFSYILFMLLFLVNVIKEMITIKKEGRKYFSSMWNIFAFASIIGSAVVICIFGIRYHSASAALAKLAEATGKLLQNFTLYIFKELLISLFLLS